MVKGRYEFKATDTKYIETIKKFNKRVRIESINGRDISGTRYYGENLSEMIAAEFKEATQFSIGYSGHQSDSTEGIFPLLEDELSAGVVLTEDERKVANEEANKMINRFLFYPSEYQCDLYAIVTWGSLNRNQALWVVDLLNKRRDRLIGVVHFPELNQFLLQSTAELEGLDGESTTTIFNYVFTYGENTDFSAKTIALDIDDGFLTGPEDIVSELQNYFNAWKAAGYLGAIISPAQAGLVTITDAEK